MPTYMDMHDIPGVKAADVVGAHEADLKVEGKYGVHYKHYWVDEEAGKRPARRKQERTQPKRPSARRKRKET